MKVLFVGDSEDLRQSISIVLRVRWPQLSIVQASAAKEGIELIFREEPDIVLIHLDSSALDCFELLSQIRSFSEVPVIVLSQNNEVTDKVRALEMGADDWVTLSSAPIEFIAKVNAILRRCAPRSSDEFSFLGGKLSVNYATHEICIIGKPVKLTPIEYKILCQLVKNEGGVVTNAELLHSTWGPDYQADPASLKKYIYRLRSKVEEDPAHPKLICTERGVGYRLAKAS